jgi:hypothetical protein
MNFQKFTTFKTILFALVLVISTNQLFAQTNDGIFFQAVARDNFSNPAKDRKIYVQSSIIQTTTTGTKVLTEEHQTNTDATGVFSISLGNGLRVGGTASGLATIDWSKGPFYLNLKIAITPIGGNSSWDYTKEWVDMGTTSFGAVPFALYSANAGGVNQKLNLTDTTKMLSVYAKAQAVQSLTSTVNSKLSLSDTASMLNPYVRASLVLDSAYINTQLKSKVSLEDSLTKYVTPKMLAESAFDTTTLSNRINLKANTVDVTSALDLKVNTTDVNTSLATKVDKVTGKDLSTNDYTTAEKTKLAAITGTNTGDQINITGNAATATNATTAGNITATSNTTLTSLSNLTTVGTITSGVWSGTSVAVEKGGTGLTSAGSNGQVLTSNGSGVLSWTTPSTTATAYSGVLPIANGGTGASSQNFVDLTTGQIIDGAKTFKENILVNYGTDGTQAVRIGAQGGNYNTMFGAATFLYGIPGSNNTAIGGFALSSLNGGNDNTAVGLNAIRQGGAADGSRNTAVGVAALSNGSGTNDNTAIGTYTLAGSITGASNVAVGNFSLQNNTSANYNVGVGYESLKNTTTGGNNTAIGHGSMLSNTSGDVNTAVGENSLISNTIGRYNTAIGVQAQEQNTTGNQNTAIGVAAIDRNTAGNYNAVLGAFSGRYIADNSTYNTAIDNSVLVGALSRPLANNANNEIVIGYDAIGNGSNTVTLGNTSITDVKTSGTITAGVVTYPNAHGAPGQFLSTTGSGTLSWTSVSGVVPYTGATGAVNLGAYDLKVNGLTVGRGAGGISSNTAIGLNALNSNTGRLNTAIGVSALYSNISGEFNTSNGYEALYWNTTGSLNTAIGVSALYNNISGSSNIANGSFALYSNTTGYNNTGIGWAALYNNTIANSNTAIGYQSMRLNTTGSSNTAIGTEALYNTTTGDQNTANGLKSLYSNTTGTGNTATGYSALDNNTTGSNNTAIGYEADVESNNLTNATAIGYQATVAASNTIQLGNTSVTNVKTSGTITAGGLGLGVNSPNTSAILEVSSTTQGFLPPRMTYAQRNLISNPANGLMVFCSDCGLYGEPQFYDGNNNWRKLDISLGSGTGALNLVVDNLNSPTNATGSESVGQSFTTTSNPGRIIKIVTSAIGGSTGTQLTNGIAQSYLRIRSYVNDAELTNPNGLSGEILATSNTNPTILNYDYGVYFPTVEFTFPNPIVLQANTRYVIQFIAGGGVGAYVKITGTYSGGQAYDLSGSNSSFVRDFPFQLYLQQY